MTTGSNREQEIDVPVRDQHGRASEEVIAPRPLTFEEQEAQMVADGLLTLPQREMDWDAFWARPRPNVPKDVAVQALIDSRGDR